MTTLLVIVVVVAVVVIVALAVANPMLKRREQDAVAAVQSQLGTVVLIEPRATAMGTDPEDAGGIRGMACLGLDDDALVAVAWTGGATWRVDRAAVLDATSAVDDPESVPKATVTVAFRSDEGEATAMFRLRDAADWIAALTGSGESQDEAVDADSEDLADSGSGSGSGSDSDSEAPAAESETSDADDDTVEPS